MIFSDSRVRELEAAVRQLRKDNEELRTRMCAVEREVEPLRIGSYDYTYYPYAYLSLNSLDPRFDPDPRPKVSLRAAIDLLREHLKVTFARVSAVPERITLEKAK